MLDREPGEADALPPQELVLLAASLVDLTRAAGEDQDRLPVAYQGPDVVAGHAHHPAHGQEIAPDRNRLVGVLAKASEASRRCFQISAIMNGRSRNPSMV